MNKLPMAMLAGAMAMSFGAMADPVESQTTQVQPKNCAELSGKKKDKCVQATPAGPVNMTTGTQKKGKSEIARDRDRAKAGNPATPHAPEQTSDVGGQPKQRPPVDETQAAATADKTAPAVRKQ